MLDIKYIREQTDRVRKKMAERGQAYDLDGLLRVDQDRRRLVVEVDELKHRRNAASDEITRLKQQRQSADALLAEMKQVSERIKQLDEQMRSLDEQLQERLLYLPNLLHDSVPVGKDEKENKEIRRWGIRPSLDFPPRSHWEIGEELGILDFERAARVTGARFVFYKGLGARLERALLNFMLDLQVREHGYEEILPPFIVNRASMTGTGQLPKFEEDLFRLRDEDYFLIPTAEVPVTNLYRDEILEEDRLPLSYAAHTPCFRREAGSYGKDTRGLIRQHQFNKVELVKFVTPESSYEELERLLQDAESVLQRLGLHYRVVLLCTGDTGFSSAKTYDIEVWLPGQNQFREISSCSNFESFQARRAGIRYRVKNGKKTEYVHTLNGSGLAIGRTVVAILENYQQKDGSVIIPEALRPYMGGVGEIRSSD
jgi:seryl-tRNA synthetase